MLVQKYKKPIISAKPRKLSYPKWYDLNARYEYHGEVQGHSRKSCTPLKDQVQALININPVKFQELFRGSQE